MADAFDSGLVIERDPEEAIKWFGKAAQGGKAAAQFILAVSLENGEGCQRDIEEAVKWYDLAA